MVRWWRWLVAVFAVAWVALSPVVAVAQFNRAEVRVSAFKRDREVPPAVVGSPEFKLKPGEPHRVFQAPSQPPIALKAPRTRTGAMNQPTLALQAAARLTQQSAWLEQEARKTQRALRAAQAQAATVRDRRTSRCSSFLSVPSKN